MSSTILLLRSSKAMVDVLIDYEAQVDHCGNTTMIPLWDGQRTKNNGVPNTARREWLGYSGRERKRTKERERIWIRRSFWDKLTIRLFFHGIQQSGKSSHKQRSFSLSFRFNPTSMMVGEFGCWGCRYGRVGASAGGCRFGRVGAGVGGCNCGRS